MSLLDELERTLPEDIADCSFDEPDTPIYLTGVSSAEAREAKNPNLGLLVQPGNATIRDVIHYPMFGADNGCFAEALKGRDIDIDAWLAWVRDKVVPEAARCLFVVAPDVLCRRDDGSVVGDARATILRSRRILPVIQRLGLPAAFVAQDGLEDLEVPWDSFDVLFIGGSTEWKLSQAAADLSDQAREHGKWVHMGRVNSWKRITIGRAQHADSFDGTFLGFGPKKNLPELLSWLQRLDQDAEPISDERLSFSPTVAIPASAFDYGARKGLEAVAAAAEHERRCHAEYEARFGSGA